MEYRLKNGLTNKLPPASAISLLKLIPSLLDIIFFTYESSPGSIFRSSALSECHGPNVVSSKKKCLTGN